MSNEIFTTANMDVIVNSLMKSAANGNMSAKMVDAVNNAINELKPGKPLSKAEKEALISLWDNLIVAVANDIVPIGKMASEYKSVYGDESMEKFALDMYYGRKELNKNACKVGAGCATIDGDDKYPYPKITATLESIVDALKVMDIDRIAELLVVSVDDIKKAIDDPSKYGKELADKVSDVRFAALCTLTDTINEFTKEDKECCCGDHKCTCKDNEDTNTDDESILVNALVKILEEEAAKKKEEEKKQEETKYKVYCFSSDDFGFKDPFIRHQKQISDLIDRFFNF